MEIELKDEERQPCEVWTRVMGYFRPVSNFNIGKKAEYNERKCFSEKIAMERVEELNIAAE
ncbi:MAG: anaerobic ribonucleoside-triphosphate reductase [Alphaproteobacteria bacterium]|nr:anaerobic ribonucleoside-triphosphate reductase [Alphaproteobacteria bacterium]